MRKTRVLISTSIFPNPFEPLKGVYIQRQAQALSRFCEVTVMAPIPYAPKWIPINRYANYSKIPHKTSHGDFEVYYPKYLIIPKFGRSLYGLLYYASILKLFKKIVKIKMPDVILAFWAYPDGFANALLSRRFKLPLVLGGLGCDINDIRDRSIQKQLVQFTLSRCHHVLAISDAMRGEMIKLGLEEQRIRVIPNGIDSSFDIIDRSEARRAIGFTVDHPGERMILFCGRLSHEKGIRYLIQAVKRLHDRGMAIKLVVVGDGPDKESIQEFIRRQGFKHPPLLVGELPHQQIPLAMNAADVFCLPSIREGWPNVLMEALGCGTPVVASRVGGVPEIVRDETCGLMVPPKDPEALAGALARAVQCDWDRFRVQGAVRGRTWSRVAQELMTVFDSVLDS